MNKSVTPYKNQQTGKKAQVAEMFDNIAHSYDFLNHFFSLGIDVLWRKKAIRILNKEMPKTVLDVATGTGDFAIEAARMKCGATEIQGVDISVGMLEVGKEKVKKKGFDQLITLQEADSAALPFSDNYFDAYTVGFGVRNFEVLENGLKDMQRVLKPGGLGIILEFSKPKKFPMKQLFAFYFKILMPSIGKLVSKDNRAYTYLPESVSAFPEGDRFLEILHSCGYTNCKRISLTGGIASIYLGRKA